MEIDETDLSRQIEIVVTVYSFYLSQVHRNDLPDFKGTVQTRSNQTMTFRQISYGSDGVFMAVDFDKGWLNYLKIYVLFQ